MKIAEILLTCVCLCTVACHEAVRNDFDVDCPPINDIVVLEEYGIVATTNAWNSVTYGNGKYVAVSTNGYVTVSYDGLHWEAPKKTHANLGISWNNIAFANGTFVLSGGDYDSNYISVSNDGGTWSELMKDSGCGRIVFGGNRWVICNDYCIYSWNSDFTQKEQVEPSYDNARADYYDVAFGNDLFVLVSSCANDGDVFTSTDGLEWKRLFTEISCQCITFDGKQFVAGGGGGRIWISDDGESWIENRSLPSNFLPARIRYKDGKYVVCGTLNHIWFLNQYLSSSSEGISWTDLEKITESGINDFCFIE